MPFLSTADALQRGIELISVLAYRTTWVGDMIISKLTLLLSSNDMTETFCSAFTKTVLYFTYVYARHSSTLRIWSLSERKECKNC